MIESPLWLSLVVLGACTQSAAPSFAQHEILDVPAACRLVNRRCSRCHTIDRVLQARISVEEWPGYVRRMRLMPSSGIPPEDEPLLTRCLTYRTTNESGVGLIAREADR